MTSAAKEFSTLRPTIALIWSMADFTAKRALLYAVLAVCVTALITALMPFLLQSIIDRLTISGILPTLFVVIALIAAYVLGQFSSRVFTELRTLATGIGEQRTRKLIGYRTFSHLLDLPLRFHLNHKSGSVGEATEQGLAGIQTLIGQCLYIVLPLIIEFLAISVVLLSLGHTSYFTILAVAGIAYAITFIRCARDVRRFAERAVEAHLDARAVLTDSLLNYETIKYFGAEPTQSARYRNSLSNRESGWIALFRCRLKYSIITGAIFAGSLGVTMAYAAHETLAGTLTVGGFVLVISYALRLIQPLENLGNAIREVAQSLASISRLLDLLCEASEPPSVSLRSSDTRRVPTGPAALTFEAVRFGYSPRRRILEDVTFHVPAGSTLAIVGTSGSGKSSIVRLLYRLFEPDAGRILIDDQPTTALPREMVRSAIAVVPQDTVLFNDTIARNISLGRPDCTSEDIEQAARLAHLDGLIALLPQGYDTIVGERGLKLSGGERQRIAIARAALKRPRIIVFDEATSSLDTNTEREILSNLTELSKTATTVMIAHRLSTVIHADQIVVLDRGTIVECGTHRELLQHGGHYARLWYAQKSGRGHSGTVEQELGRSARTRC